MPNPIRDFQAFAGRSRRTAIDHPVILSLWRFTELISIAPPDHRLKALLARHTLADGDVYTEAVSALIPPSMVLDFLQEMKWLVPLLPTVELRFPPSFAQLAQPGSMKLLSISSVIPPVPKS